ncbi:hypothetical protein SAMN04488020_1064 [Palleronia marisminoris]|uniref:CsgH-like domain-containing protein n=1 Tax=Palleronia marisminoris TaxID=315423 RepID=A0A1Y5SW85_9RHOB|nr:curli-like amyloid fiber formation chaperone CsgH [Palleronia marisminoris]SFH03607.1 hypothetical protein SAMN04488020_1064 [Palleronia marisminoris]SLN49917.1 hypothetical protein PAM7066_02237 [Palleronia marisminoris]
MLDIRNTSIMAALLALGAGGLAASASAHDSAPPFSCTVQSEETRTGVHMAGSLTTAEPIVGTYSLKIQSRRAGTSVSLQQTGEFEAAPDTPAPLGSATLPGDAGDYEVAIHVGWNGRTYACVVLEQDV